MELKSPASRQADASLAGMADMFRRGSMLVDAALAALTTLNDKLAALDVQDPRLAQKITALAPLIEGAAVNGDNLLVATLGRGVRPLTLFTLARQGSGAVSVQSIEIDRATTALSDGGTVGSSFAYDVLRKATRDNLPRAEVTAALHAMRARAHVATSRLSISKARLDLQSSFLDSVTQADAAAPVVRLESHLNVQSARDMALATRRLLGRESLNIANGNKQTLQDIVARHVPRGT